MATTTEGLKSTGSNNLPDLLDRCLFSGVIAVDALLHLIALSDEARILLVLPHDHATLPDFGCLPASLQDIFRQAIASGEARPNLVIQASTPTGDKRNLRISTTLTCGPDEKFTGVIAVINDVTPARQLEQNLRQMDRLASIGTLSASMAHEVKNALVAVKTFVDLLIKKNQDATLADIVGREMNRIDSIVSQMLRFGGPARPALGIIHLHQVIEQSLNLVQHHIEGRKIRLVRELNASSDTVPGDAYQLEQAFINLFFNALDAMGVQGELRVQTEFLPAGHPDAPCVPLLRVIVQDNGIGISSENLGRLFEPFFTTKPNGTGLGLPITRRIIEEHRGQIDVTSDLYQGTRFCLLLPSAARQP